MVKITFKNVGQGDSIILEWEKAGKMHYGIIDCNIYKNENPVINHLENCKIDEIDFIILSHPHMDHFSGMISLFEYCLLKKKKIKRFLHTCSSTPDFLKSANRSIVAEEELLKLFLKIKEMRDSEILEVYSIDDNPLMVIPLDGNYRMEVLSPSSIETDNYVRGVQFPFDEEDSSSNPNANWLSTILKICNDEIAILLTSDIESKSLTRIGKKHTGRIKEKKVLLAQIPHHGSKKNLNRSFWTMRKRVEETPVIISVGENGYKHPSKDVVDFFDKTNNYVLYSTNMLGALSKENDNTRAISSILDVFSVDKTIIGPNKYNGDKVFILENNICKNIA